MAKFRYEAPDGSAWEIEAQDEGHAARIINDIAPASTPRPAPSLTGIPGFVTEAVEWLRSNPQVLVDMAGSGVGAAGGIAGGAMAGPAAPVAMPVLGAGGAIAGREVARDIATRLGVPGVTPPGEATATEDVLDAVSGALGPAGRATGLGAARMVTGAGRTARRQASTAAQKAMSKPPRSAGASAADTFEAAQAAHDTALRRSLGEASERVGNLTSRGGDIAALGTAIVSGDLMTAAMFLAGGRGASAVQRRAAESLLNNPRVRNWIVREMPAAMRETPTVRNQMAASLTALAGETWLTGRERRAIGALNGTVGSERDRLSDPTRNRPPSRTLPFSRILTDPRGVGSTHRDAASGRFVPDPTPPDPTQEDD